MPFNGSGIFQRLRSWIADAAAGLNIQPDLMDADTNDIALALNNVLTRDGQATPTADIPWAGKKITKLGAPVVAGDALSLGSTPATEITAILGSVPWTVASLTKASIAGINGYYSVANTSPSGNQIALGWDGANIQIAVDSNSVFGHLWYAQNLTFGAINAIAAPSIGNLLGTANLTPGQMNAQAGVGQLYGTANLTAGQIATILGYIPGRVSIAGEVAGANGSDLPVGTASPLLALNFVATAPSLIVQGNCSFFATGGAETVQMYLQMINNQSGGSVVGVSTATTAQNGVIGSHSCGFAFTGLGIGVSYTLELMASKANGSYLCSYVQPTIEYMNA